VGAGARARREEGETVSVYGQTRLSPPSESWEAEVLRKDRERERRSINYLTTSRSLCHKSHRFTIPLTSFRRSHHRCSWNWGCYQNTLQRSYLVHSLLTTREGGGGSPCEGRGEGRGEVAWMDFLVLYLTRESGRRGSDEERTG